MCGMTESHNKVLQAENIVSFDFWVFPRRNVQQEVLVSYFLTLQVTSYKYSSYPK